MFALARNKLVHLPVMRLSTPFCSISTKASPSAENFFDILKKAQDSAKKISDREQKKFLSNFCAAVSKATTPRAMSMMSADEREYIGRYKELSENYVNAMFRYLSETKEGISQENFVNPEELGGFLIATEELLDAIAKPPIFKADTSDEPELK